MSNQESLGNALVDELSILNRILSELTLLQPDAQKRIIETVMTFLGIDFYESLRDARSNVAIRKLSVGGEKPVSSFSEDRTMSPKKFFLEKQPESDVERVACLAYYLTHYRNNPFFKTIDISKLNTEAAQRKFSNATYSVNNATKLGYLVPASRGQKQLSASGEMFVQTLPDHAAARAISKRSRPRRRHKDTKTDKP